MHKLLIGAAIVALVSPTGPAMAQAAPPPGVAQGTAPPMPLMPPRAPRSSDAPRVRMMIMSDHVMARADMAAHIAELFGKIDLDHDGYITKDEVGAFHQKMMGAIDMSMGLGMEMQKRVANHEMPMPDRAVMFDRLDANHDGVVSRQEYMAARPQILTRRVLMMRDGGAGHPEMHGMQMEGRGPGMGMGMGMHMGMAGFGGHLFDMVDTNHDGRVSLAEAQAAALAHFNRADLNHDGQITPDERQQAHQTIRERGPG